MEPRTTTTLTPQELVKVFPEALGVVREKLKEWKAYRKLLVPLYEGLLDGTIEVIMKSDIDAEKKKEMVRAWNKLIYEDEGTYIDGEAVPWGLSHQLRLKQVDRHIARLTLLEKLYKQVGKPARDGELGPNEISLAKTVPIGNYLSVNRAGFTRCPYHSEKTPSCRIYDDNHAHCYGCDKSFDVIDLVMKLQNLEFIDAVKYILNIHG